jgi:hypothetical protein
MLHDEDVVVVQDQVVVVVQCVAVAVEEAVVVIAGTTQGVTLVERRRRFHAKSAVKLDILLWTAGIGSMKPIPLTTKVHLRP